MRRAIPICPATAVNAPFDAPRYRAELESAYLTMSQRHCDGLAPASLDVAAFS